MTNVSDYLEENGYEGIKIFSGPGYDSAFIGVSTDNRAVYDYDKMVEFLVKNDEMTYEEAAEFIDYNVIGFYTEDGPVIIYCRYID